MILACAAAMAPLQAESQWRRAAGPLMTPFAADVSPANVHREYPRMQMARDAWLNLNGLWEYAIAAREAESVEQYQGDILVPFCVESALSGVMKRIGPKDRLWYRRTFTVPQGWAGQRVLIHFEAVDWETTVWVNGREIGRHQGGYDPFRYDITGALKDSGEQEVVVAVWDPTGFELQPHGKQWTNPGGIWYTPVSGIWQTVWLEPVPQASIARLHGTCDVGVGTYALTVAVDGAEQGDVVRAEALVNGRVVATAEASVGRPLVLKIEQARLWTPGDPFLYDLDVSLLRGGKALDSVDSYFGMREVSLGKDEEGYTRILLNGSFLFQYGTLDQGWWPDGLYTPATDKALRFDLETLKKLGCNMLREHIKVGSDRLYYHCDKLGLLVWQDMPCCNIRAFTEGGRSTPEAKAQFRAELKAMIDARGNHPCIVMWVPFNEGWSQHDTEAIAAWVKQYDPSRLVNNASGWVDKGVGDVYDIHHYPDPLAPPAEEKRAIVLGEFGGLALKVPGHLWRPDNNWGYSNLATKQELTDAYVDLTYRLHPLIGQGLSGAVYTQTSDVEIEVNGLMTYDRAMLKMDAGAISAAHAMLHTPPPKPVPVVPTSEKQGQTWRFTTEDPGERWADADFDDQRWKQGPGGFGANSPPRSVIRTPWNSPDIWLRRTFRVDSLRDVVGLVATMHHDENAEIYVNGHRVCEVKGFTTDYQQFFLGRKAASYLVAGENVLAVHCHQTRGGQYIDVGIGVAIPHDGPQ